MIWTKLCGIFLVIIGIPMAMYLKNPTTPPATGQYGKAKLIVNSLGLVFIMVGAATLGLGEFFEQKIVFKEIVGDTIIKKTEYDTSKSKIKKLTAKKLYRHLTLSSNLDGVDELLERRINRLHPNTNLSHIDLDFSIYPQSAFHITKYKGVELAELDSGALVKVEAKKIYFKYTIQEDMPALPKGRAEHVANRRDNEIDAIVKNRLDTICIKLKQCLEK